MNLETYKTPEQMIPNDQYTEQDLKGYFDKLIAKIKQDPNYELQKEFGRMLMMPIDSFTKEERARYDELKQILCKPTTNDTTGG